jgi:hypothetical protein
MKKVVTVFARDTFISASDGSTKVYKHAPEMFPLLGSAKLVKLQWIGHRSSKSTAEVTIRDYESSYPVRRPSEVGSQISLSGNVFTALRPAPITVPASFQGLLEIVVEVRDSDGSPVEVQVEGELWATLIFEE